ncbi:hypothetical protein [Agromyces bauzanensis]
MRSTQPSKTPILIHFDTEWSERYSNALIDLDDHGVHTGAEWLSRLDSGPVADRDELLLELLRKAQAGSVPAERTVLKSMMPKIVIHARVAYRRGQSYADSTVIALSAGWEAIRTINTDRSSARIRRTLGMEILHIITSTEHIQAEVPTEDMTLSSILEESMPTPDPYVASTDPVGSLIKVLSWAVDAKVVTREEVAFIARAELGERSLVELAEEEGQSYEAFRKRVLRSRKRLTEAVGQYMSRYAAWE